MKYRFLISAAVLATVGTTAHRANAQLAAVEEKLAAEVHANVELQKFHEARRQTVGKA